MAAPTPSQNASTPAPPQRGDALPRGAAKALVVALAIAMAAIIFAITLLPSTQVRLPIPPDAAWDEALIIDRSRFALETLGHRPLGVIRPNPDSPSADGAAVVEDPSNPVYQTVYWSIIEHGMNGENADASPARWRVTVKRLDNEFIAWPSRAD